MRLLAALLLIGIVFSIVGYVSYDAFYAGEARVSARAVGLFLVGVDDQNNGVLIPMKAELKEGTGKILMNIDSPSFIEDTQASMRTAVAAAENYTGIQLGDRDIVFSLDLNYTIIGGPSAGAAVATVTSALLMGRDVNPRVVITGAINDDGSIGRVGGILEKANALKGQDVDLFLVPVGESASSQPVQTCNESRTDESFFRHCSVEYREINVSAEAGVRVEEVADIGEALRYILE